MDWSNCWFNDLTFQPTINRLYSLNLNQFRFFKPTVEPLGALKEIVQLLLDKGAKFSGHKEYYLGNALTAASYEGHIEIVQLLLEKGALIDSDPRIGERALIYALSSDQEKIALLLIENGAGVGAARHYTAETPLERACSLGSEDVVRSLLDKGAAVNPQALLAAEIENT